MVKELFKASRHVLFTMGGRFAEKIVKDAKM